MNLTPVTHSQQTVFKPALRHDTERVGPNLHNGRRGEGGKEGGERERGGGEGGELEGKDDYYGSALVT